MEEHDAEVRAEERKKAEIDFQNGEYWNDYLSKVLADERAKTIDEFANWLVEQGILGNRCIADGEITDYGKVYAKKYKEQLKERK